MTGELGTLLPTWCFKCNADVKPIGKGQCPRCGRVLRLSFLARKHPVNKLRRQQLLDKLVADYRPRTTMQQSSCEMIAGILEQLEVLKAGGSEHQRLVQLSQQLGDALEGSRPPTPTVLPDLTEDELIERAEKLLAVAKGARAFRRMPPVAPAPSEDTSIVPEPGDSGCVKEITPATTPAEPTCGYGCGSLARCAEIKAHNPDAWRGLHYTDPEEVARRDKAATAVMLKMMPYGNPY